MDQRKEQDREEKEPLTREEAEKVTGGTQILKPITPIKPKKDIRFIREPLPQDKDIKGNNDDYFL